MTRATILALALIFVCVSLAFEHDAVDQCDWSGSGDGGSGGVRSVYPRCSQGTILWHYPRGALRILLSLPNSLGSNQAFRACVVISGPARVFLESNGRLIHLYSPSDGKHARSYRCFRSRGRATSALFMEAETHQPLKDTAVKLQYNLDPSSLRGGTLRTSDEEEECRPCSTEELVKAYCESDLVARGTLTAIQQQSIDKEAAELTFRVTQVLRQVVQEDEGTEGDITASKQHNVRVRIPAACDARHGYGEFVIMAKRRFDDLILVCGPRLDEWGHAVREVESAPCLLIS